MRRSLVSVALLLALHNEGVSARRKITFASPLQSLTIPDREIVEDSDLATPRDKFLPKYKAGLTAELECRKKLGDKNTKELQEAVASGGSDWAERTQKADRLRRAKEDALIEQAFDKAVAEVEEKNLGKKLKKLKSSSNYQFVGVVNRRGDKPITWYARTKPSDSKWSVRLLHVNKDAIIKDLFNRGKVDIFAKYENTGKVDEETKAPVIASKYEVRERSWKNLWNFSPKHFFTDPSGMYWRERRVRPGLYTDGVNVYESSYRYRDGRNGMYRVSGLQQFLASKAVAEAEKEKIMKRLQKDAPDIVLEL